MNETKKQLEIINKLRKRVKGNYCIKTFGCQMNEKQSETYSGILEEIGYKKVDDEKEADFILYNTCSVRESAELRVFGRLGHLKSMKEKNKDLIIALCGCMPQNETTLEKIKEKQKHIDIIFGTHNGHKLPELLENFLNSRNQIIDIWEEHGEIVENLPTFRKFDFKSCVNIMYGCNNFCTYCIVPYVRGRERSREVEDIVEEVRDLVKDGVLEIMLLGQNVNSYGVGLNKNIDFPYLLKELNKIEGLKRIRFMTSHPKDFNKKLIKTIKDCDKVCNNVHLPVQSGSNKILKKMNRKYTREEYLRKVQMLKKEIPTASISTDLIIGFPGETDEDFKETLKIIEDANYDFVYSFIYSKREGTPAAKLDGQVSEEVSKKRYEALQQKMKEILGKTSQKYLNKEVKVLVEKENEKKKGYYSGRSEENYLVHFKSNTNLIGEIISVKIKEVNPYYLIGKMEEKK